MAEQPESDRVKAAAASMLEVENKNEAPERRPVEEGIVVNGDHCFVSLVQKEPVGIPTSRPSRESVLQRLSEALLRRSLTKIDLSQRGLWPTDARLVKMALLQNANLSVLKLGYNNLGDEGVAILAAGISVHKSLVSLDLGFNNIGDEGCIALANGISGSRLQTLYLAGNLVGEDGAYALADVIRRGCTLTRLYMTGNRLGADGVKALTEAILEDELRRSASEEKEETDNGAIASSRPDSANVGKKRQFKGMQDLFLGGTGMANSGCRALSRLLGKTTCLKVLSLANCNMGDEEVATLATAIKSNRSHLRLEALQLSFNAITSKGLEALMNAIWGSSTLRELRLDNNEIGDRGAHHVAAILPYVTTLQVLDVGFNKIQAAGTRTLMKVVAETQHLKSLSVSGNTIDTVAAKSVAYALAYNRSLISLFLDHCSINFEGQRHISAGIVSNSRTGLRKLTGFVVGPVIVTIGFPPALEHWTNEQVLNFIHLMWDKSRQDVEASHEEKEIDPLNFLPDSGSEQKSKTPLEATVVVEVAKKAFESLVANGVDIFSRQPGHPSEISSESPLANDAIMIESTGLSEDGSNGEKRVENGHSSSDNFSAQHEPMPTNQARSFVAPPEAAKKQEPPDPSRKRKIVEWLCSNIQYLNEMTQKPFNSRELWRLHQHYFTPVVNESGGSVGPSPSSSGDVSRAVSSVPDVSLNYSGTVTPSIGNSSEEQMLVPGSDPSLPASPAVATSLPILKRKVSYRFLGDAMLTSTARPESRNERVNKTASISRMIEEGVTGHSLPPKTKRARRNRTRISFVPRIKAKLDSYLDVCHEKALITMRQLYFVEQALLSGRVNPIDPATPRSHLCGVLASEAEMIIVDMI